MYFVVSAALAADGAVTVPLSHWESMLDAAELAGEQAPPLVPWMQVDRTLSGSFRRGVFNGVLETRVYVPAGADDLRVPVLDDTASIARVSLDGRSTSLLPESGSYTVGIDTPGEHVVRVEFFTGREDDRFAQRLQLALPPSGPTRVSILVPDVDIDTTLTQGAVTALRQEAGSTRIEGQLDGRGQLDLSWKGQHRGEVLPVKAEARSWTLFTLHEALVKGVTELDTVVLEGETDRIALQLPEGVEIVDVSGEAVLQWRTEPGSLVVLLRYLVADRAKIRVSFQLPVDLEAPVVLRMPTPAADVPTTGAIGVQGPAGFTASVRSKSGAEELRDLPPELAAMTPNPLLLGFEVGGAPALELDVKREAEVELTSTAIDELEASTVLIEDGAEITRLQLHVRNQTRQYLSVRLPEGAVLTHARLDGSPMRPATAPDGALLLPLVQSERLSAGQTQTWTVRSGDTLDAIADRFYGDPSEWGRILDENRDQLYDMSALNPGQTIRIPPDRAGALPERRFVIDLAWTRAGDAMGALGHRGLTLPEFDTDVGEVEWHVFVPDALEPLQFSGNLSAYSHIRYDHFRRLDQFWDLVWRIDSAWAGGSYSNILQRRKAIYAAEIDDQRQAQEVSSAFPIVGERYRFKRMLPGREVPHLALTWVARDLLPVVRVGALLGAIALTLGFLGGRRMRAGVGFVALLGVAWYVEGVHRRLLWGIDLALLAVLARAVWPGLRDWLSTLTGRGLLDLWTLGNLMRGLVFAFVLGGLCMAPLLWSSVALLSLTLAVRRAA
jgi:hypothetical protein